MKDRNKKLLLSAIFAIIALIHPQLSWSQCSTYYVIESEQISPSLMRLSIIVYGKEKKTIDADAMKTALNVALFDGIPRTLFQKPLLDDGFNTSIEKYPAYFSDFYNYRYRDFIQSCIRTSKFKKADKNNGTQYDIEIKIMNLRKDLEKNQIRKKLGI